MSTYGLDDGSIRFCDANKYLDKLLFCDLRHAACSLVEKSNG